MILFELYRQLDVRMYQTIAALDQTFGSCAKYVLQDDSLVLLGTDHSIRLNMANKEATIDNPIRNWDIEAEACLWFSEGSAEALIVRAINNSFRQWLDVDPFSTREDYIQALAEINLCISKYNLKILSDDSGMSIYANDSIISFEQAIDIITEADLHYEQTADLEAIVQEGHRQKSIGQLANAVPYYEQVLRATSRPDLLYTVAAFELAECYYFIGNYERAVSLYYRCNLEFIADEKDFYVHLGHALLDTKMKKYEREIKIYYRSKLDPDYIITHKEAVEGAAKEVGPVFSEYEETCYEMGQKKYAEHRNALPIGADDIDELMLVDDTSDDEEVRVIKTYSGIKLTEPLVRKDSKRKSDNELFAQALDLFLAGDYQKAFDIYYQISKEVPEDTDYYTWAQFQMGKLYCIFDDYSKAIDALSKCNLQRFGVVYRLEDFLVLYQHIQTVCDDFESDLRYRKLLRGRFDFYYAQYDREYNQMLRDHRLVKKFIQYEKDCITDATEFFGEQLPPESQNTEKTKKWKLFGKKK